MPDGEPPRLTTGAEAGPLERCRAEVDELRRTLEQLVQRQEGAESVRRGQLDCLSERVFQAEKDLRLAEERQHDAIEKASATFTKHSCDVEQERQNLTCVISQVNQNFDHISGEIHQHKIFSEQSIAQLQTSVSQTNAETRNSMLTMGHDLAVLERTIAEQQQQHTGDLQLLEHTVHLQQQQLADLHSQMQAMCETVSRYTEAEVRQQVLSDRLAELEVVVANSQLQQKVLMGQLTDIQEQVSCLFSSMAFPESYNTQALSLEGDWRPLPTQAQAQAQSELQAFGDVHRGRPGDRTLALAAAMRALNLSPGDTGASAALATAAAAQTAPRHSASQERLGFPMSPSTRPRRLGEDPSLAADTSTPAQGSGSPAPAPAPSPPLSLADRGSGSPQRSWRDLPGRPDALHTMSHFNPDEQTVNSALLDALAPVARQPQSAGRPCIPEASAVPAPVMGIGNMVGL